ncbi:MAG: nitronate monooxygenase [Chloroflexi bacterium]|nr:nitronate monooxygenase [Chloroflexota bacterium]
MRVTKNPLKTSLTEEWGLEYPIIAFGHCKDVIAEVCNAGGLGVLGCAGLEPDEIERDVNWLRERIGNKPFGLDILIPASVPPSGTREDFEAQIPQEHWAFVQRIRREYKIPERDAQKVADERAKSQRDVLTQERARAQLDVLIDMKVPIFCAAQGNPAFIIPECHSHGIKVFGLIGLVRQARREHEAKVDYIVAHGQDGGGHCGPIGTFTLVPQVVSAVEPTPVLAAGGVACGRQLAAALALGAVGVWTGTAWLASKEHDVHPIAQKKLLAARSEDTVRNRWADGAYSRHVRTKFDELWDSKEAPPVLPRPMQGILMHDLVEAARESQVEEFFYSSGGEAAGMIHEVKPARQIMYDWANEAMETFERMGVQL